MKLNELLKNRNTTFYASLITMVILPVHVQYLPPFMIAWGLFWMLENGGRFHNVHYYRSVYKILFLLFLLFYFWKIIGLLYSADLNLGLSNLFGRLSLILFPLLLVFPGDKIRNNIVILLRVFALSIFFFMIFCYGSAFVRSLNIQDGQWSFNPNPPEYPWLSYFYSSELVVSQHPSYIAMYVLLAVFFCFEAWFDFSIRFGKRIGWLIIGLFLLISEYFLSSRAGILSSLILVPLYFMFRLKSLQRKRFVLVGIIVTVILLLPVIAKNRRVDLLYNALINRSDNSDNSENRESERLLIWKSAISIAKSNLLFGVGIGDVREELANHYLKIGQEKMAKERLNAHNQFLEVLLENGVIGLLIFIIIFAVMLYISFLEKNILYGIFTLMIIMFFMFETVLYRLAGVTFFSLFSFILLYVPHNKEPT